MYDLIEDSLTLLMKPSLVCEMQLMNGPHITLYYVNLEQRKNQKQKTRKTIFCTKVKKNISVFFHTKSIKKALYALSPIQM